VTQLYRVIPCARGKNIFATPPTKTAEPEFKLKNRCKSAEEAKVEHVLFDFSKCKNTFTAKNAHDKAISVGESN